MSYIDKRNIILKRSNGCKYTHLDISMLLFIIQVLLSVKITHRNCYNNNGCCGLSIKFPLMTRAFELCPWLVVLLRCEQTSKALT